MTGHSALSTRPSQLPCGYKQTEVGVIPEDWEVKRIDSVCTLINGRGFKPFEWRKSGLPIIRIQNLNGSEDFNFFDGLYDKKLEVEPGTLLFAWSGSRGTSFGPHMWSGPLAVLNYHTWKVNVHDFHVSKSFFFHALRKLTAFIEDKAHGASALVHTQKWEMESFLLPLPPTLAEQEAIAEALSDADALIESLEQLIAKKRLIKQGAMQELLTGKRRLPGFSGEWEVKRLGEVAQPRRERIDPRYSSPHEFCIELEHIEPGTGCLIGYTATSGESSLKSVFRSGDVLFGKLRAYLRKYWLADQGGVCSTEIWALVGNPLAVTPGFLYQLVRVDRFIEVASTAYGTHMPRSDWNVVMKYQVHLPPVAEQTAIASILSDMDAEIVALEERLEKARLIKQGMMQELLTGKRRLIARGAAEKAERNR